MISRDCSIVVIVVCSESYYYSIGEADSIISISMGAGGLEIWGAVNFLPE